MARQEATQEATEAASMMAVMATAVAATGAAAARRWIAALTAVEKRAREPTSPASNRCELLQVGNKLCLAGPPPPEVGRKALMKARLH